MNTTTWLLIDGGKKYPIDVLHWTATRYWAVLLADFPRGQKVDRLYLTSREVEKLEQKALWHDECLQMSLFEDSD